MRKPDFIFAESEAESLLESQGIEDAPVPVEKIAKSLGFEVFTAKFDEQQVAGYVTLSPKEIIVNRTDAPTRRAFTIAHEVGHVRLHESELKSNTGRGVLYRTPIGGESDPIEKEANCFAVSLLVPEFLLRKYHSYDASESQLASIFGVSTEVMRYRLKDKGYR